MLYFTYYMLHTTYYSKISSNKNKIRIVLRCFAMFCGVLRRFASERAELVYFKIYIFNYMNNPT